MTPEQATEAVKALKPQIYYPYHYGQVDEPTDVEKLARMLDGVCDVRIRELA
jgi:L-ascorbate metabolism protein UlaG (beta-lactamase superfamily)